MPPAFLQLDVWKKGMLLTREIYVLTRSFPKEERYGLIAQMRAAAISVPTNIAEGNGRATAGEYMNALSNARGSVYELHSLCLVSVDLGYVQRPELQTSLNLIDDIERMLARLRSSLERSARQPRSSPQRPA
ncbi:MAG TPA: four helix bundle protein [Gemmatimonadaceae bacterium]|nr:four helix bundle protein [Gemmatimonadaceae bacterium]